jgi:L-lactate dehydrogenase complex protein LldG
VSARPAEADLERRFADELRRADGVAHPGADAGPLACSLLPDRSAAAAVDDDPELEDVAQALADAGHDVLRPADADYRARLPTAGLGVTRCVAAIADTGTLLLVFDRAHPRSTSLLPRIHLAVLHPGDFVPTLADALARIPSPPPSAVTFVTGPSRSADIEQILTLGVHGPAQVHAAVP